MNEKLLIDDAQSSSGFNKMVARKAGSGTNVTGNSEQMRSNPLTVVASSRQAPRQTLDVNQIMQNPGGSQQLQQNSSVQAPRTSFVNQQRITYVAANNSTQSQGSQSGHLTSALLPGKDNALPVNIQDFLKYYQSKQTSQGEQPAQQHLQAFAAQYPQQQIIIVQQAKQTHSEQANPAALTQASNHANIQQMLQGGQAITLSGLNQQQLQAILQVYGVNNGIISTSQANMNGLVAQQTNMLRRSTDEIQQLQGTVPQQQQPANIIVVQAQKEGGRPAQQPQQMLNVQSLNAQVQASIANNQKQTIGSGDQLEPTLTQQDMQLLENLRNHQLFQQQKQHLQQQQINQLQRQINLMRVTRQHQVQSLNNGLVPHANDDSQSIALNQNLVQSLLSLQQQQVAKRSSDQNQISHLQQRHSVPLNFDPNAVQIKVISADGPLSSGQQPRKQSAYPSQSAIMSLSQTPNMSRKEKRIPTSSVLPQKSSTTINAKDEKKKEIAPIPTVQKSKTFNKKNEQVQQSSISGKNRQKSSEPTAPSKDSTANKRDTQSQNPRYNTEKKGSNKFTNANVTAQNSAAKDAQPSPFGAMLEKAKDIESVGVLHSRQNVASANPGTSSIGSNNQIIKKKTKKSSKQSGTGASAQVPVDANEKDKRSSKGGANQSGSTNARRAGTQADSSALSSAVKNRQGAQSSANASIHGSSVHKSEQPAAQNMPPLAPAARPDQTQVLTAKERRRMRIEAEKERERQLLEKNFKASSLYISKQSPTTRTFITKPTAIVVYHDSRLVKLDINRTPAYQPSAVPQTSATPKPLLLTPEELQDFYRTTVRLDRDVGRAMEVVEEPKHIFREDQLQVDPKQHSIQERKIYEVLQEQVAAKRASREPDNLAKNPIIFPSQNIKETTIFFNSRFESGNLHEVEKLHEFEYNCYVNFDFNSTTHSQWYFFSVRNIAKGRQYKFNIMNLQKDESCYQIGMKPFVYSVKRNRENSTNQWRRACENVCYYKNKLRTRVRECAPDYEFDEDNIPCYEYDDESSQMVTLNTLSFCYEFDYENDITFFAYFQPYTLSDLEDYLYQIPRKFDADHLQNIYKCEKLCDTVGKRPCYVITITDNVEEDDVNVEDLVRDELHGKRGNQSKDFNSGSMALSSDIQSGRGGDEENDGNSAMLSGYQRAAKMNIEMDPSHHQKQTIFLTARVHPGESNASFMIQGAIDFLLQNNNKEAKLLRETFIFKIIPMLNPDGVCEGHYRANYVGADLNRRWPNPSKLLHPTIHYTKRLLKMCHADNQVLLFCDFHGHTRKRNVFMYGCVSPQNEINQHKNNNLIRLVPYLLDQKNKLFSFNDCKFANEKEKESTGRLVMFKEFGILNSYTIESTFYSCYNPRMGHRKKVNVEDENQIKVEELVQVGRDFCETLTAIVNSKILKRKFILDTTNPLGAMIPGQGGNPLTQFLMNQNKAAAEERSSAVKEPKEYSGAKSFVTGIAQSSISQFSSNNRDAMHYTNTSGAGTSWTEKKRIKRLQTEHQLASSATVPSVAPKAGATPSKTIGAGLGPNTVQHVNSKVSQISASGMQQQVTATPSVNSMTKKIQIVRSGVKSKAEASALQTLVDPLLSQEQQNFPQLQQNAELNSSRPLMGSELMPVNRVPSKKINSFSLNGQSNMIMSPALQNIAPMQSLEQLQAQAQQQANNMNREALQNYLNKMVVNQQQQSTSGGAVFEQFGGQLAQSQPMGQLAQAIIKTRAEPFITDLSDTHRGIAMLSNDEGKESSRKRQCQKDQQLQVLQPAASSIVGKAQNFSVRRFEALLNANSDKQKMSKTQLMQRPTADMIGQPKQPIMIDTAMLQEAGVHKNNELKLSLDGLHSPQQKVQQSMTPQINRSTADKLRRESDGNNLGKVGSAILSGQNTPQNRLEGKLETSQTQRKIIKTNEAFKRAANDSIHNSKEMMPKIQSTSATRQVTIKDQNNFLQGLQNLVEQQNFFFGSGNEGLKDVDVKLFRTSITSQNNAMAGINSGAGEPIFKELLLSAATSNQEGSEAAKTTFENMKKPTSMLSSINEGATPFFHNVDSFDNMVNCRSGDGVQGLQQLRKMVDLPMNQFPLEVIETEQLRRSSQKNKAVTKALQSEESPTNMHLLFQKQSNKRIPEFGRRIMSKESEVRSRKKDSSGSGSIDDQEDAVLRESPDLNLQDVDLSSGIASSMTGAHLRARKVAPPADDRKKNLLKPRAESEAASSEDEETVKAGGSSQVVPNAKSRQQKKMYDGSGIDSSGLRALEIEDSDEKSYEGSRAKNAARRASSIDETNLLMATDIDAQAEHRKSRETTGQSGRRITNANFHALTEVKPSRLGEFNDNKLKPQPATQSNSPDRIYYMQNAVHVKKPQPHHINSLFAPVDTAKVNNQAGHNAAYLEALNSMQDFDRKKDSDQFSHGVRGVSFGHFNKAGPAGKMPTAGSQEAAAAMLQQKIIVSPDIAAASMTQNGNFFGLRQQKSKSSLSLMRNNTANSKGLPKQQLKSSQPATQQRLNEAAFVLGNSRPPTSQGQMIDVNGMVAYQMLAEMMPTPIESFNPNSLGQVQQKKMGSAPLQALGKRPSNNALYFQMPFSAADTAENRVQTINMHEGPLDVYMNQNLSLPMPNKELSQSQMRGPDTIRTLIDKRPNSRSQQSQSGVGSSSRPIMSSGLVMRPTSQGTTQQSVASSSSAHPNRQELKQQNQMLEMQQRVLQQRRQLAEQQILQLSQNIIKARHSYNNGQLVDGNSAIQMTATPQINSSKMGGTLIEGTDVHGSVMVTGSGALDMQACGLAGSNAMSSPPKMVNSQLPQGRGLSQTAQRVVSSGSKQPQQLYAIGGTTRNTLKKKQDSAKKSNKQS